MRRLLALAAVLATCALLLLPSAARPGRAEPRLYLDDAGPVILYDRPICSLVNADATAASIEGQDGGSSIDIDGTSYFVFGDTGFLSNPQGVTFAPNNVAVSTDTNASDCISMTHKAAGGVAQPLLAQRADETTLWPDGLLQAPDGGMWFFVGSVVPGPSPWYVRGVGLGHMDRGTLASTRVVELLWDQNSGFQRGHIIGARGVTVVDGTAYLLLHTGENAVYLARVPLAEVPAIGAYEYWTGSAWSKQTAQASPLWVQSDGFNGPSIQWSDARQEWMALYSPEQGRHIRVRTAPDLTGPWSAEHEWIDCARFVAPWVLPMCYSPAFHPQYDRDGGRTMTISFSIYSPYQVVLHEVRLAVPVYHWSDAATGETRLQPLSPGAAYTRDGIAFYASDVPAPGLGGVHRYIRPNGEQIYTFTWNEVGTQDKGIAFYASPKANPIGANLTYDPVYRWDKGSEHLYSPLQGLGDGGYTRGPALFYGICGDADLDAASDCLEDAQGTDPALRDTDGDGFGDRPANTANPNWVPTTDNCPSAANPGQENIDGEPWLNTDGVQDWTNPKADALGDACDPDMDNDGLSNGAEATVGTNPRDPDTDGDLWPDGAEQTCGSNPLDVASEPQGADSDGDRLPDACETAVGGSPSQRDTDNDGIIDSLEVRWLTNPRSQDTDGDGLSDACEIASINIDKQVTSIDLMMVARLFMLSWPEGRQADLNRDGVVLATDLVVAARNFGVC